MKFNAFQYRHGHLSFLLKFPIFHWMPNNIIEVLTNYSNMKRYEQCDDKNLPIIQFKNER